MVIRSKVPPLPHAPAAPARRPESDVYYPGDAIPVPDVIETDSDSAWAMWSDAIEGRVACDDESHPPTQLMGLPELPRDQDA